MKLTRLSQWSLILCLGVAHVQAQETKPLANLDEQLKQLQERLEKQQRDLRESFERMLREQQAQIDALKKQLEIAKTNAPPAPAPAPAAAWTVPLVANQKAPAVTVTPAPPPTEKPAWSPAEPIRIGGQRNYINLSFDALVAGGASTANDIDHLELGGHDPKQRGFTVQNLETVFEGAIDPYFRGQANIIMQIDPHGDTTVEAEEAYLQTMSLPWNLQVKAGQFFSDFGRLNATHPHTWDFVDQPLVNGRFFGEDGLRSAGTRLSWLAPTPFYSELFLAVQNSQGGTAHSFRNDNSGDLFFGRPSAEGSVKSLDDMLFVPHYAASFDLSDSQTLLTGASAAFGPNGTGEDTHTQIYGLDLFWKWKSPNQHSGFPFVGWQNELMWRRFEAGAYPGGGGVPAVPRETVSDYGFYSQLVYGFHKGWVAGLRGDYVFPGQRALYENIEGPDLDRASRWRISPNLTYYPSEFAKLRLQYNFDHRNLIGDDHSVWLQFEFLLGSHAAHKF
jgi:hypothetical protein